MKGNPDTESLYVDSYTGDLQNWDERNAPPPYLANEDTGYVHEEKTSGATEGYFGFTNPSGNGSINGVTLYVECYGDDTNDQVHIFVDCSDGSGWVDEGTITVNQLSYDWETLDLVTRLDSWDDIQNVQIYLSYAGVTGGDHIYVRRAYLYVDYTPIGSEQPGNPGYEDFTDYEEEDPNSHIGLVGTTHIDFYSFQNETAYLYKDKGVDHFGSNWEHKIDVEIKVADEIQGVNLFWALTNDIGLLLDLDNADKTLMYSYLYRLSSGEEYRIYIREIVVGTLYEDFYTCSKETPYYLRIKKVETAFTIKIYDTAESRDAETGDEHLLDTLSLTLHGDWSFRYIFAANSYRDDFPYHTMDADIDNLNLLEPSENSVSLTLPSNDATEISWSVDFKFNTTVYDGTIQNASLHIANTTVVPTAISWDTDHWNTTVVGNDTETTINYSFSGNGEGSYKWNVQVYNSTTESLWASNNYTLTVDIPPRYQSVDSNATSIVEGGTILLYGQGYDGIGLGLAWLATNETGSWKNYTSIGEFVKNGTNDHFTERGYGGVFGDIMFPIAHYYNGVTYITFCGGTELDPYITSFNHTSKEWNGAVKVADSPIPEDGHGAPSMIVTNDGYIHVFYGCHNDPVKHAKSDNPEDISAFTVQTDIGTANTYPQLVKDTDGYIYLYVRHYTGGVTGYVGYLYKSTDNASTWDSPQTIMECEASADRIYTFNVHYDSDNGAIHFVWHYHDSGVTLYAENAYYAYYNISDTNMYNITGGNLGTTITKSEADASCIASDSGSYETYIGRVTLDESGKPYLIWSQQQPDDYFGVYFCRWNGTSWTTAIELLGGTRFDTPHIGKDIHVTSDNVILVSREKYNSTYDTVGQMYLESGDNGETWSEYVIITQSDPAIRWCRFVANADSSLDLVLGESSGTTEAKGWALDMLKSHNSPIGMNNVADTWTWSNFTWSNSSISSGTQIQWRIYYDDTYGNVNGTNIHTFNVGINVAPVINQLNLTETTNSVNITSIVVNTNYHWKCNVTDEDNLNTLVNITIRIENNPGNTIGEDSPTFTESSEYWFRYVVSGDDWEWYSGSVWTTTETYLNISGCINPTMSGTNGWFVFEVKLSKIASYSSQWEFGVLVFDDGDENDAAAFSSITVSAYSEITIITTTHTWTNIAQGTNDNLIDEGDITFNVTCNYDFDIQVQSNASYLVDAESHQIGIGNVTVHATTLGSSVSLTTTWADVGGLTGLSIGKDQQHSFKLWLDVPAENENGDYQYVCEIRVQAP